MSMVQTLLLPLPKAHKLIPEIVARWNRSKGRVDEMTCYLDGMTFYFSKGYVKAAAGEQKRSLLRAGAVEGLSLILMTRIPPIRNASELDV